MHLTGQQFGKIRGLSVAPVYGAYVSDLKKERKHFQWHILRKTKNKRWGCLKNLHTEQKNPNSLGP